MQSLILVDSKSPGIGGGLTYENGSLTVKPGSLVRIPVRGKVQEGLVIAVEKAIAVTEVYALKPIEGLLSEEPLLSEAQLQTMRWMAQHYFCSLRGALTPFLPAAKWSTILKQEKKQRVMVSTSNHRHAVSPFDGLRVTPLTLSSDQQAAYESMKNDARPSLLFGVTGSGKTEVYSAMIGDAMRAGKQSIVLVPEILLTEHIILRLEEMFPRERIAVVHSKLTPTARRKEWQRIRSGEVALVIGSRSALFAPCHALGLVIIDEEHEWTYKNEQTPRYHARDVAEKLCECAGAKLVLGTATPSLESWARAKSGHYHRATLPKRYRDQAMPTVRVIDLASVKFGSHYPFSPPLLSAIEERLKRNEQSILFLNRRGSASAVLCLECRRRLTSPQSNLPFTLHYDAQNNPYLLDHFSGVRAAMPDACPHCKAHKLLPVGAGTQRIEKILSNIFPDARMLRADSDTLDSPEDMRALLKTMRDGDADILLGTQSVVKGLDLPLVTLAVVLVADVGMSLPHFRAGERTFQLLTQLTGRSGRASPGEVIVQTFRPDCLEVKAASEHRTSDYLDSELSLREKLGYPPATSMIRFILRGPDAAKRATSLQAHILRVIAQQKINAQAMVAPTLFGNGSVWHVLLRGNDVRSLLPSIELTDVIVDIDPLDCL